MFLFDKKYRLTLQGIFVLLFSMLYFRLFRPLGFTDDVWKLVFYPVLLYTIGVTTKGIFRTPYIDQFSNAIRMFFLVIVVSSIVCLITWGQSIFDTLLSSVPFFSFVLYYYLIDKRLKVSEIENVLWWFLLIFIVCFYIALAVAPTRLFLGYGEIGKDIDMERGMSRIRLTHIGAGPLYLCFFLAISKLKYAVKKKNWLLLVFVLFVTIVLQLGRQAILFSAVFGLLLYLQGISVFKKIIIVGAIAGVVYIIPLIAGSIFQGLKDRTEQELESQEDGEDNVRIAAYRLYTTGISRNILNDIFGNGLPSLGKSTYGEYIDKNGRDNGLIPNDVGYASLYLYYGFVGMVLFLFILVKVMRIRVDKQYSYAKYYIYFLYCGNVAGSTLLWTIPTICLALYILSKGNLYHQFKQNQIKPQHA